MVDQPGARVARGARDRVRHQQRQVARARVRQFVGTPRMFIVDSDGVRQVDATERSDD